MSVLPRPRRLASAAFAATAACSFLRTTTAVLEVPYGLPKLDLVALPHMEQGAAAGWGLCSFG